MAKDVSLAGSFSVVPSILEVICQSTGMGFAALARVTEDRWIACGVRDEMGFGLEPNVLTMDTTSSAANLFGPDALTHQLEEKTNVT